MQRFKAALTTGRHDPNNPEDLRRDPNGEYVLYSDVLKWIKVEGKVEDLNIEKGKWVLTARKHGEPIFDYYDDFCENDKLVGRGFVDAWLLGNRVTHYMIIQPPP